MDKPSLDRCLAYAVISNYSAWLGEPSVNDLEMLLLGAATRAELTSARIPQWRISGPLEQKEFYLPIVARTGHPTLSIRWAMALEMIYFSREDAFAELRRLLEQWDLSGIESPALPTVQPGPEHAPPDLTSLLRALARRPGMYLGSNRGWALRCFLHGMARGGDWLSLPALPALDVVIHDIEARSNECYGSPFAAYRIYDAAELLLRVGIEPAADPPKRGADFGAP